MSGSSNITDGATGGMLSSRQVYNILYVVRKVRSKNGRDTRVITGRLYC